MQNHTSLLSLFINVVFYFQILHQEALKPKCLKTGKGLVQTFLQRYTNGHQAQQRMLNIIKQT